MQEISTLIDAARSVLGTFDLAVCVAGNVAAALETEDGTIYTGICLDLACGVGFCAEHSAVAEMLKHRETAIRQIVAVGDTGIMPPCGRCRELLMQVDRIWPSPWSPAFGTPVRSSE